MKVVEPSGALLKKLCEQATSELLLVSPYLGSQALQLVWDGLVSGAAGPSTRVLLVTERSKCSQEVPTALAHALERLTEGDWQFDILSASGLHAKCYAADRAIAYVGSANLTMNGWSRGGNYELLMELRGENEVAPLTTVMQRFWDGASGVGALSTIKWLRSEEAMQHWTNAGAGGSDGVGWELPEPAEMALGGMVRDAEFDRVERSLQALSFEAQLARYVPEKKQAALNSFEESLRLALRLVGEDLEVPVSGASARSYKVAGVSPGGRNLCEASVHRGQLVVTVLAEPYDIAGGKRAMRRLRKTKRYKSYMKVFEQRARRGGRDRRAHIGRTKREHERMVGAIRYLARLRNNWEIKSEPSGVSSNR